MSIWQDKRSAALILGVAGISVVLGLLATLLGIGYLRQKDLQEAASQESVRAKEALTEARDAVNRAARTRDEAEALVGFILDDLRHELDLIGRADLLVVAAEKAVQYFDSLPPELITQDSLSQQASVLMTLAQARYSQDDLDQALADMRRGIALRRKVIELGDPEGTHTFVLGREISELGLFQNVAGDREGARATYQETLELFRNPPPGAVRDGHWDFGVATAHFGMGEVERRNRQWEKALAAYQKTLEHVRLALTKEPDNVNWIKKVMNVHNNSGVVHMYLGDFFMAETNYLQALDTVRTLIRMEPKNRRWEKELGTTLMNLGTCLDERSEYERAEPFIREALTIRQGLAAWDSKNARTMRDLAHVWRNLASLQYSAGQTQEAWVSSQKAMNVYRRLLTMDPGHARWIADMQRAAEKFRDALLEADWKDEARQLIEETTAFAESNRRGDEGADAWNKLLAGFYSDLGRLGGVQGTASMLEPLRKSLQARAAVLKADPEDSEAVFQWVSGCLELGRAYQNSGLTTSAQPCYQLAHVVLRDLVPADFSQRDLYLDYLEQLHSQAALESKAPVQVLVPAGSTWRYWDERQLQDATSWTALDYDDAPWALGPAPLGYGEGDLATVIHYGSNRQDKHLTAWFRHTLTVESPKDIGSLKFRLRRDDGAVVYWNGREIIRDNLRDGDITPTTLADMVQGEEEAIYRVHRLSASQVPLLQGTNVLGVEVHQNERQSSDLSFDLELQVNAPAFHSEKGLDLKDLQEILGDALPENVANHVAGFNP